jgi:hypothetical protein
MRAAEPRGAGHGQYRKNKGNDNALLHLHGLKYKRLNRCSQDSTTSAAPEAAPAGNRRWLICCPRRLPKQRTSPHGPGQGQHGLENSHAKS